MPSRRAFLGHAASLAAATVALPLLGRRAFAQASDTVDINALMAEGALPDIFLGKADAPVTIVEYASLTCGHCAAFHASGYKTLVSEYIDTGKVRFVLREFPLDPLAAAGFMLARRAPGGRYYDVVDTMFERQKEWAYSDNPVEALKTLAIQFGYSPQTFEQTLSDQALLDSINAVRQKAADSFGVDSTPTFFINGERVRGAMTPDLVRETLARHVPG